MSQASVSNLCGCQRDILHAITNPKYLNKMLLSRGSNCFAAGLTNKRDKDNPLLSVSKNRHTMITHAHAVLYKIIITMCAVYTLYKVRVLIKPSNEEPS